MLISQEILAYMLNISVKKYGVWWCACSTRGRICHNVSVPATIKLFMTHTFWIIDPALRTANFDSKLTIWHHCPHPNLSNSPTHIPYMHASLISSPSNVYPLNLLLLLILPPTSIYMLHACLVVCCMMIRYGKLCKVNCKSNLKAKGRFCFVMSRESISSLKGSNL